MRDGTERTQATASTNPPTYAAAGQFTCPSDRTLASANTPHTGTDDHHNSDNTVSLVFRYRHAAAAKATNQKPSRSANWPPANASGPNQRNRETFPPACPRTCRNETQSWPAFQMRIGTLPSKVIATRLQKPGLQNSLRRCANRKPATATGNSNIGYFASTPRAEHVPANSHQSIRDSRAVAFITPTSAQHQHARNGGSIVISTPAAHTG